MRKTIKNYEGVMISKILSCKTTFDVLAIIDKKVELIQKRTNEKRTLRGFIDNSLFDLRKVIDKEARPNELSKIRVAIGHLQSLEMHYKNF